MNLLWLRMKMFAISVFLIIFHVHWARIFSQLHFKLLANFPCAVCESRKKSRESIETSELLSEMCQSDYVAYHGSLLKYIILTAISFFFQFFKHIRVFSQHCDHIQLKQPAQLHTHTLTHFKLQINFEFSIMSISLSLYFLPSPCV